MAIFSGWVTACQKISSPAPFTMCPKDGKAYNCYFPMPFLSGARIEIHNESDVQMMLYYYIDYEEYKRAYRQRAKVSRPVEEGEDTRSG